MEYKEYKPHPLLAPFIECYWTAYSRRPPFREQESLIPDGMIELMFNFGDDYKHIDNGQKTTVKGSHIIGIRRKALVISQTSRQHLFCIRFRMGGAWPFVKIPVCTFADQFHTLRELLGKEYTELEEQLYEAGNTRKRIEIAENFLLSKIRDPDDDYRFVQHGANKLLNNSSAKVGDLAAGLNTTYKTLERKFSKVLGVTPAELIRIKRFNKTVSVLYSGRYHSLTDIAYRCGYYDQSHFIREFKQLTGYSPGRFLKEQFTIVQVIQPALTERLSKSYNF